MPKVSDFSPDDLFLFWVFACKMTKVSIFLKVNHAQGARLLFFIFMIFELSVFAFNVHQRGFILWGGRG